MWMICGQIITGNSINNYSSEMKDVLNPVVRAKGSLLNIVVSLTYTTYLWATLIVLHDCVFIKALNNQGKISLCKGT